MSAATHCIPYNPDCTVCNPPYEWPDNYKPIPPKATFQGVAINAATPTEAFAAEMILALEAANAALAARLAVLKTQQERFASLLDCLEPRLVSIVANRTADLGACTQEPDGCSECLARECLAAVATARAALAATPEPR